MLWIANLRGLVGFLIVGWVQFWDVNYFGVGRFCVRVGRFQRRVILCFRPRAIVALGFYSSGGVSAIGDDIVTSIVFWDISLGSSLGGGGWV